MREFVFAEGRDKNGHGPWAIYQRSLMNKEFYKLIVRSGRPPRELCYLPNDACEQNNLFIWAAWRPL